MGEVVARHDGLSNVSFVVCDLDGVVYLGSTAIPGAREALESIKAAGHELVFATNNSTRTAAEVAERIRDRTGFGASPDQVIGSGLAAASWLRDKATQLLVIGEAGLRETLVSAGLNVVTDAHAAEAVVVGLDRSFDYEAMALAMDAVANGAVLYATNKDATFPTESGLRPGGGSIVAAIEAATSVRAIDCGKPNEPFLRLVRDRAAARDVLVVGDRPETDIALGRAGGWSTALVLTGVTQDPDGVPEEHQPDVVIPSIADVPGLLGL